MTYTPINWQNGDTITAEKLNKMDNGWSVENTQLFSETVTAAAGEYGNYGTLAYAAQMNAPSVIVTFDGTDYTCNAVELGGVTYYGGIGRSGPDFSEYPFAIESAVSTGGPNGVYTQTAGQHTIAVVVSTVQTSDGFAAAVAVASSPELFVVTENTTTWQEVHDAVAAKKLAFVYAESGSDLFCWPVMSVTSGNGYEVAAGYVVGGGVNARYYQADTADGPIYSS